MMYSIGTPLRESGGKCLGSKEGMDVGEERTGQTRGREEGQTEKGKKLKEYLRIGKSNC